MLLTKPQLPSHSLLFLILMEAPTPQNDKVQNTDQTAATKPRVQDVGVYDTSRYPSLVTPEFHRTPL